VIGWLIYGTDKGREEKERKKEGREFGVNCGSFDHMKIRTALQSLVSRRKQADSACGLGQNETLFCLII